jgi:hypothetical protein
MHSIKYDKIQIIKQIHDKDHPYKFQYTNTVFGESMKTVPQGQRFTSGINTIVILKILKFSMEFFQNICH